MPAEGFAGANVTVPHKGAALAVADELSEVAREVGAANTLSFEDGVIHAYNTDAEGFLAALPGRPGGKRALVLGAGGAARAVVWALVREGAEVEVWNRTELRSRNLCAELGGTPGPSPGHRRRRAGRQHDRGRAPRRGPVRGAAARGRGLRRRPDGRRPRLRRRSRRRCWPRPRRRAPTTVDGFEVLARQGAVSLQIWTGRGRRRST